MGVGDPEIILIRGGYYTDFPNKTDWIAFNPTLARYLGWLPCDAGYFAWQDERGVKMVESLFWQSGNINRFSRGDYETSEGWMVVVNKQALKQLSNLGALYTHKFLVRSFAGNVLDRSHQTYKVTEFNCK